MAGWWQRAFTLAGWMDPLSRRQFLALSGAASAGLVLAGCGGPAPVPRPIEASDPAVATLEQRRRGNAAVRDVVITAGAAEVDLGGGLGVTTWAYNGSLPGPEVRIRAGEVLRARFINSLPQPTTIHWHGLALRNDMDGVPELTQASVPAGGTFQYEFTVPDPGTYWFHPHTGLQLDRGLYTPLIVEDPAEPGSYDREYTVVLDDWSDGLGGKTPEENLDDLRAGRGPHAAHIAAAEAGGAAMPLVPELRSSAGDVNYPLYLINGRRPTAPVTFEARPGERLRLRLVNAASDTPFRVAVGGHRMVVTHTDGFPVDPVAVDNLVITMAERYDVVVTVNGSGVFPLVASADLKSAQALALIRSGPGDPPRPDVRPAELEGRVLRMTDLRAAQTVRFGAARPDRLYNVELGGGEKGYVWTINGRPHGREPLKVREGEKVRLSFTNRTVMFHPIHLHGHTFQVVRADGEPGPRKDTTIVRPDDRVAVDFVADNPGQWMLHCHNLYHQVGGMMTTVSYVQDEAAGGSSATASAAAAWDRVRMACRWAGSLSAS